MQGLSFEGYPFTDLFAPILPEFAPFYWFVDSQVTPFDWEWLDANESRFESIFVDVPALYNTSAALWKPGTLPDLAPQLRFDEWTYLTGFLAVDDEEAASQAAHLVRAGYGDPEYFDVVERHGAVFIVHVDGWWEVYAPPYWLERLKKERHGTPINAGTFGRNHP